MRFARRYDCRTHCTSKAVRFLIPGAIPLLLAWGPLAIVEAQTAGHKIYVANYASDTLGVFPINANGNVASLFQRIRLSNPGGIAYHAGNLYVANHSNDSITIFPANATGRPNTISTIRGSNTQLYNPGPITVDGAGTIYVINTGSQDERPTITSYAAGSHGDVSPKTVIKGPHARLDGPSAIATDAQGNIYVTTTSADQSHDSILVFSSGSNGNASPARVISGAASRVRMPGGIAVSAKGYIYVTTEQVTGGYNGVEILIFGPGTNGDTAPVTRIDGGCDPSVPTAGPVALGSDNQIYVLTTELNP